MNILPALKLRKLPTLEKELERLPHERSRCFCRVDGICPDGEAGSNRLVDIDHYKCRMSVRESEEIMRRAKERGWR